MDRDEYYRQQASDAQQMSDRAITEADKLSWLRIAQSWMQMMKAQRQQKNNPSTPIPMLRTRNRRGQTSRIEDSVIPGTYMLAPVEKRN